MMQHFVRLFLAATVVLGLATTTVISQTQSLEPAIKNAKLHRLGATSDLGRDFRALADRVDEAAWVGYQVPMVPGNRCMCCGDHGWRGVCHLEGKDGYMHTDDDDIRVSRDMLVLYRLYDGRVQKIRTFSADCALDAGGKSVYWWSTVDPAQSLSFLESQVDELGSRKPAERAVQAIALHAHAQADEHLESFATDERPEDVAEKAIFWMGAVRGQSGFESLKRVEERIQDTDLREQITFALYLSRAPEATTELIRLARHDASRDARGKALFWLGQKAGKQAAEAIQGAIENDPDLDIKKKAVFALSQLPSDEGVPLLIDVARTHRQPEIRKKAMFWLGQSEDPRALDFFEEVLLKN
jgi:HEAT repeat protein